jgi:hypothetical protein
MYVMKRLIPILIVLVLAAIGIYYYLSSGNKSNNSVNESLVPASVSEPLKDEKIDKPNETENLVVDEKDKDKIPDLESLKGLEEESEKLLDDPLKDVLE